VKYQHVNVFKIMLLCSILLSIGLISTSITHAQAYTFVTKWGSGGAGPGLFSSPWGIATDSSGNVYVADTLNDRIQKFDNNGTYLLQWGSGGAGNGTFYSPYGVAVDSLGNVYVADTSNNLIQKFNSSGTYITQWGGGGAGHGLFSGPYGVAVDSLGNVYVADTFNELIQKFDNNGTFLTQWGGGVGAGNGQFNGPYGVAADSFGNVYVADTFNNRIQKFDSNGNYIIQWGSGPSPANGQFYSPYGVAVDSLGNVYIADTSNNRIQKFYANGNYITQWGSLGPADGKFYNPHGVAVDLSCHVFVADTDRQRIQKFAGSCKPLSLQLTKLANASSYSGSNQDILYTYIVTNAGNVDITAPITVTDNKFGTIPILNNGTLSPGSSVQGIYTYTTSSTDVTNGSVINLATATNSTIISNTATQIVTGPAPLTSLQLTKVASPQTYSAVGNSITYTYNVINLGNVDITGPINITDNITGTIPISNSGLNVGSSLIENSTYVITQTDLDNGSVTNTATVYNGSTALNQTQATITAINKHPALTITKTPNPLAYSASGQTIAYTYTVKNTGDVEIKGPITVTDDKFGTITIPNNDTLGKDSSVIETATYKITDSDINADHVTNSAYATGSLNSKPVISPIAIAIVRYEQPAKKEEHNEEEHNGDRDNYSGPGYGGAVVPVPMYSSPMYGNPMYGNPMYGSEPATTAVPSEPNVCKDKCALNKHKHKHHAKKHKAKKNC
jgi:uncharacterized repeat protein (TIGR01451 family)